MAEEATRISPNDTFPGYNGPSSTSKYLDDINLAYSEGSTELKVYDVDVIDNMIDNIILTSIGERHYEPEFGSEIPALLQEPCDEVTAYYIETELFKCLSRWLDSYIDVDYSRTTCIAYPDDGFFDVLVAYVIKVSGLRGALRVRLVQ